MKVILNENILTENIQLTIKNLVNTGKISEDDLRMSQPELFS